MGVVARPMLTEVVLRLEAVLPACTTLGDLFSTFTNALLSAGVRSAVCGFDAGQVVVLATGVPRGDAVRIEALLGHSLSALTLPVAAFPNLLAVVESRRGGVDPGFTARLVERLRLTNAVDARRLEAHLGPGPMLSAPLEAGDVLLGAVVAWAADLSAADLPVMTRAAELLAGAWHRIEEQPLLSPFRLLPQASAGELRAAVRALLDEPGALRMALQPIRRIADNTTLGFEALCRFSPVGVLHSPDELYAAAEAVGLEGELDAACLRAALPEVRAIAPATLFCNVSMNALVTDEDAAARRREVVGEAGVSPADVVFELSVRSPVGDAIRLRRVVAQLRQFGFRVAIDNIGAGHASLLLIAELRPDFLKVDRSLMRSVHASSARRAVLDSLVTLGGGIRARVIVEGVETEPERDAAIEAGVRYAQGWLIHPPVMLDPPSGGRNDAVGVLPGWFAAQSLQPFATRREAPRARVETPPEPRPRRRRSLPHALSEATRALQEERDPRRILEVIADQLDRVVPSEDLTIYVANIAEHRFVPVLARGDGAAARMQYSFSLELGITGIAFESGIPQNIGDAHGHPAGEALPGSRHDRVQSLLVVPLIAADRCLGTLNLTRSGLDRFTERDVEAAGLFAYTAASAWRNAQMYDELAQRLVTDPLTGLLNSRWLHEAGARELARSRRSGKPLGLLLIDLDDFKRVNDTGGHAAGDLVLQRTGQALRTLIRAGDAAVRLGGEEFLVLLTDSDRDGALRVATQVLETLARVAVPPECVGITRISGSIGVAIHPDHAGGLEELIRRADLAMYEAKRTGGQRIAVAGEEVGLAGASLLTVGTPA